ncbi:jade-1 [Arthroderma uncinatum]|uniref:jade-1 n=1 Tax=Arthroderma uncinatum TaxID=74035 RepID=UPI00144ADD2E|nr:jade-1 [Arthroderma uncinatum]KAF3484054.1 jade-1 [Arthroderma uncinatum]
MTSSTASVQRKSSAVRTPKPRPRPAPKGARNAAVHVPGEPPPKKLKYVPGGPGGGGRYIEVDDIDPPVRASSQMRNKNSTPRTRPSRDSHAASRFPPATPPTSSRSNRQRNQSRRYSSAAAAVLAVAQGEGYMPREERGWEEFHPDLDIDAQIAVFSSKEVDGLVNDENSSSNGINGNGSGENGDASSTPNGCRGPSLSPSKRRLDRPRRTDSGNSINTPDESKTVSIPGPNPREKLTLPKPSWVIKDPFLPFEQKGVGQQNYVDRTMASVGYQESDVFLRHDRRMIRLTEGTADGDVDLEPPPSAEGDAGVAAPNAGVGRVEYDMDEQDARWLEEYNLQRKAEEFEPIKPAIFEITMTKIEKEWHALERRIPKPNPKPPQTQRPRSSSAVAVNGENPGSGEEQDSKCAICDDGDCENANAIVFCDGCDLAVHQECYGVPYIPEGQWLCRKCQLIGRGSPSCIFCPNTEGAFKQTNTSKWSHLLCAVWIPEVSIGNPSLMEPVIEIEKVPRSRWKLTCYICRQKMGACIQCSNKNCFVAFHPTCGRRAHLYLRMKLTPGAPAVKDSNELKAFCDKHVPPDWQTDHNTASATAQALEYYRTAMQGKKWGDSQAAALAMGPEAQEGADPNETDGRPITPRITLTVGSNNKRKRANTRTIWKLPSGAPVIPRVVLDSVVASLARFTVRQRKQYAEDACKYWTLKREARRGAALLKRLQLSLETFSSMEMTRRNFSGMGRAGTVRLERRIDFAERLYHDIDKVRMLCGEVKKREKEKLKDAETLQSIIDIVYFPIPPMLWPVFEKAQALDGKGVFFIGFQSIRSKLEDRYYTSVSEFSRDLAQVFTSGIGVASVGDTAELQMQISGRAPELSHEQREKRKLAKRIIKAIQPLLEDALKRESELNGKPYENELKGLDLILENSVGSRRGSINTSSGETVNTALLAEMAAQPLPNGIEVDNEKNLPNLTPESKSEVAENPTDLATNEKPTLPTNGNPGLRVSDEDGDVEMTLDTPAYRENNGEGATLYNENSAPRAASSEGETGQTTTAKTGDDRPRIPGDEATPPTPPASFSGGQQLLPLAQGGIQWYMQPFDPIGTTIHEERWTGRELVRGMSEELSDIGDEELRDLAGDDDGVEGAAVQSTGQDLASAVLDEASGQKTHKTRKRWRGFK